MANFFQAYQHKPVCQWVMCYGSHIPSNAVPGGEDGGETAFIGRAVHDDDVIPGKVLPSHSCCYVSYAGVEHSHREYQVLVSDGAPMAWVPASHGSVPNGAIQGGACGNGEPLYIGRAYHNGTLTIGKVHPSHNCLYIPYGGDEHRYTDYEVLVCKTINFPVFMGVISRQPKHSCLLTVHFARDAMEAFGAPTYRPVCEWVMCFENRIPYNAVPGGEDSGETIYIGRAVHNGEVIPGKVVPSHSCCYVAYEGAEHSHRDYQALISDGTPFTWAPASDGAIPTGAVQGGVCASGEPLYIGRTYHEGTLTIGKVQPSRRCLFIPYGGEEHCYSDYEVLAVQTVNF
ncbi:uncharacterized protein LOC142569399 [Dermacentor variabilis]|uniref:uncharacterized protein LOC142569399 n=1 Tax=Dermacentor variabilis TaxID=34621 RepID=UPI003F5C33C8